MTRGLPPCPSTYVENSICIWCGLSSTVTSSAAQVRRSVPRIGQAGITAKSWPRVYSAVRRVAGAESLLDLGQILTTIVHSAASQQTGVLGAPWDMSPDLSSRKSDGRSAGQDRSHVPRREIVAPPKEKKIL